MKGVIERAVPEAWQEVFRAAGVEENLEAITEQLSESRQTFFPPEHQRYRAFTFFPPEKLRVVILGQDPYHTPGKADGLAFSSPSAEKPAPSLRNVFKELQEDLGVRNSSPDLGPWARDGVLLLNTSLTVPKGHPKAHSALWRPVTQALVKQISLVSEAAVWLLWGRDAQAFEPLINPDSSIVLTAFHPSPLTGDKFFGCKHFSRAQYIIKELYGETIDWET